MPIEFTGVRSKSINLLVKSGSNSTLLAFITCKCRYEKVHYFFFIIENLFSYVAWDWREPYFTSKTFF